MLKTKDVKKKSRILEEDDVQLSANNTTRKKKKKSDVDNNIEQTIPLNTKLDTSSSSKKSMEEPKKSRKETPSSEIKFSRYLGVSFNKRNQKWEARFQFQHRSVHLGLFDNEIQAAKAYDEAVFLNRGSDAPRNFEYEGVPPSKQSSKFRGVNFDKRSNKWKVTIKTKMNSVYGGLFEDEGLAAKEYDKFARELHGDRARLNFPDSS